MDNHDDRIQIDPMSEEQDLSGNFPEYYSIPNWTSTFIPQLPYDSNVFGSDQYFEGFHNTTSFTSHSDLPFDHSVANSSYGIEHSAHHSESSLLPDGTHAEQFSSSAAGFTQGQSLPSDLFDQNSVAVQSENLATPSNGNQEVINMPGTFGRPNHTPDYETTQKLDNGSLESYKHELRYQFLVLNKSLKSIVEYMETIYSLHLR
jgi:hypothetical protein